jgi:neurotransmitter:Na+ symporter, NSS family
VLAGESMQTFVFWVITFSINIFLVYRGISKGIEKFVSWAMPTMAVLALIVLIRVLTLGTPDPALPDQNVINGLGYMWNPDFTALTNAQTWLAAAGQIFFSLSVGFGVIINYASYMKKRSDVVLSGLTASATNELFEVGFGGLITLTASFIFLGLSGTIAAVAGGSFGLGFTTLPVVFAHMPFGNVVGAVWFFMLFLAAITSSISMYQPTLAFFEESLGWARKQATTLLVALCLVGSFLVMYYSRGSIFLDTIDSWVGTFLIFILAMVQIICFSWVFGIERGWKEAHLGAQIRIPGFYKIIMKYVAPLYLIIVFFAFCAQNLGSWVQAVAEEPLRQGALALILAVTILLVVCTFIGERRWRAAGMDLDGRQPAD